MIQKSFLLLAMLAQTSPALALDTVGQVTSYPVIDDLTILKNEVNPTYNINPNSAYCDDGADPNSVPALAQNICILVRALQPKRLGKIRNVTASVVYPSLDAATRAAADKILNHVDLIQGDNGYDYKINLWNSLATAPTNTGKFAQYWFNAGGKVGKLERIEWIPPDASVQAALVYSSYVGAVYKWNKTDPTAQTLFWQWHKTKDLSSKSFSNTYYATIAQAVINSNTNTAEISKVSYSDMGTGPAATYKFRVMRNADYSLFEGYICNASGGGCSPAEFQCVRNSTKIVQSVGTTFASVNTGNCAGFSAGWTLPFPEPTQANLNLLNDTSGDIISLNPAETMN